MNERRSGKATALTTEKLFDLGYAQPNYLEFCWKLCLRLDAGNPTIAMPLELWHLWHLPWLQTRLGDGTKTIRRVII